MARPKKNVNPKQGERMRVVLEEQGITQNELADLTQTSRQSISRYINCRDQLQDYVALSIANAYGYNAAWLMCLDDRKYGARDFVEELEHKDESFASFLTILDDALESAGGTLVWKKKDSFIIEGVSQKIIDNAPLHAKPHFYDFAILQQGKTVAKLSGIDLKRMQKRLVRYTKMLIEELIDEKTLIEEAIEEGGTEDGEQ